MIMEHAKNIVLIVFMATASSTSTTVTNMAYYYEVDEQQASFINIMSVLFLVITLPVMIRLYQWVVQ
jgi:predicted permease